MPSVSVSLMIGSVATSGGGKRISAPVLTSLVDGSPASSANEGTEDVVLFRVSGVDTLDSDDTTAFGVTVATTDLDLYLGGVLVGAMVDQTGGVWELAVSGVADPLLAADSGSYTARRTATVDGVPKVRSSAAVAFTVTLVEVTNFAVTDQTPDEGDALAFTGSPTLSATIASVSLRETNVEVDTDATAIANLARAARPGQRTYHVVVTTDLSGAREIVSNSVVVDGTAEAPTLDLPADAGTIAEGETAEPLAASGVNSVFDANTDEMRFLARLSGVGSYALLDTDASSAGGWTGEGDYSAFADTDAVETIARRVYTDEVGEQVIDSAASESTITAGGAADWVDEGANDWVDEGANPWMEA
jgi:hypothetical protein